MIHHTELIRLPSDAAYISAPVQSNREPPDCGLTSFPSLTRFLKLDKHNRNGVFVSFLCTLTVLHACTSSYFLGTAKIWRLNYHFSEVTAEWIVYLSPILGGFFSLVLGHFGNVIHRPCYIGGLAMLHAVCGWTLIIPEVYHPSFKFLNSSIVVEETLCKPLIKDLRGYNEDYDEGKSYISMGILLIHQLFHGLTLVSMTSHGVTYIDDGVYKFKTPLFICLMVALAQIGRYIGLNLTLIPIVFNRYVFFSVAWLLPITGVFIFGFLISLFTKVPQNMLLNDGVNHLLRRLSTHGLNQSMPNLRPVTRKKTQLNFFTGLKSIFTSTHLLLNVLAATFMHTAILNFNAMREEFFRSRFVNFPDDFDYHFSFYNMSSLIFMCLIIFVMGQVIYKWRPSLKFFVIWLIVVYFIVTCLFASYAFLTCEDKTTLQRYDQVEGSCNYKCKCTLDVFEPVCLSGKTYYSPCFAGCTEIGSNGYYGCACDTSATYATAGSCNADKCKMVTFFAEANSVVSIALLVSAFVVHIIISLRTVRHSQMRSSGIAFLFLGTQLLPYIPFKFIYEAIKSTNCLKSYNQECFIFKQQFALIISLVTIGFMLLSIVSALCMLRGITRIEKLSRHDSNSTHAQEMHQRGAQNAERERLRQSAILQEISETEDEPQSELSQGRSTRNGSQRRARPLSFSEMVTRGEQSTDPSDLSPHDLSPQDLSPRNLSPALSGRSQPTRVAPSPPVKPEETHLSSGFLSKTNPNITESDGEGFGDSDIDPVLERLEEDTPKCLKRQDTFTETGF